MIKYRNDLWRILRAGPVAEIGVAEGNFSEDILNWPTTEKIYLVDRWMFNQGQKGDGGFDQKWHDANHQKVKQRMLPYGDRVLFLRGDSVKQARHFKPETLEMVYIDADHSYDGVLSDLIAWTPIVRRGGIVALHDYLNPAYGVKRAVETFVAGSRYHVFTIPEDKMEDAGAYFVVC
jgi:cephalosporin hydroxylase